MGINARHGAQIWPQRTNTSTNTNANINLFLFNNCSGHCSEIVRGAVRGVD